MAAFPSETDVDVMPHSETDWIASFNPMLTVHTGGTASLIHRHHSHRQLIPSATCRLESTAVMPDRRFVCFRRYVPPDYGAPVPLRVGRPPLLRITNYAAGDFT